LPLFPQYNISPTDSSPVVVLGEDDGLEVRMSRWGMVPFWATSITNLATFNARVETVADKPTYRKPFGLQHCLVLTDGWYEWRVINGEKYPYLMTRPDGGLIVMAGLWDIWQPPGKEPLHSFTDPLP